MHLALLLAQQVSELSLAVPVAPVALAGPGQVDPELFQEVAVAELFPPALAGMAVTVATDKSQ
jgi:hypothetical protein